MPTLPPPSWGLWQRHGLPQHSLTERRVWLLWCPAGRRWCVTQSQPRAKVASCLLCSRAGCWLQLRPETGAGRCWPGPPADGLMRPALEECQSFSELWSFGKANWRAPVRVSTRQVGRVPPFSLWGCRQCPSPQCPPPALRTVPASHPAIARSSPQDSLETRHLLNSACQLEANLHWIIIFN